MITLSPHPSTLSTGRLHQVAAGLAAATRRAERRDSYDAESLQDALDEYRIELAARGAREPEAVARHLDAYDVPYAEIAERR